MTPVPNAVSGWKATFGGGVTWLKINSSSLNKLTAWFIGLLWWRSGTTLFWGTRWSWSSQLHHGNRSSPQMLSSGCWTSPSSSAVMSGPTYKWSTKDHYYLSSMRLSFVPLLDYMYIQLIPDIPLLTIALSVLLSVCSHWNWEGRCHTKFGPTQICSGGPEHIYCKICSTLKNVDPCKSMGVHKFGPHALHSLLIKIGCTKL